MLACPEAIQLFSVCVEKTPPRGKPRNSSSEEFSSPLIDRTLKLDFFP
jgi:hypothetical protein